MEDIGSVGGCQELATSRRNSWSRTSKSPSNAWSFDQPGGFLSHRPLLCCFPGVSPTELTENKDQGLQFPGMVT